MPDALEQLIPLPEAPDRPHPSRNGHGRRLKVLQLTDRVGSHGGAEHLTMQIAERLDPTRFARMHRSTIVQVDRIQDIVAAWHGDFDVTLQDGTVLRLTRNYRDRVLDRKKTPAGA